MCLQGGSVGGGVGRFHAIGEDFPWYILYYYIQKNIKNQYETAWQPTTLTFWNHGIGGGIPPGLDWEEYKIVFLDLYSIIKKKKK